MRIQPTVRSFPPATLLTRLAAPFLALALSAGAAHAAQANGGGMALQPSKVPGWELNASGDQVFYLCRAAYCGPGSTVSITPHKAAPKPLASRQAAIRADIMHANGNGVMDVTFGAVTTANDRGLVASYQDHALKIRLGAAVVDAPFNRYGYIADPSAPWTISIVSSASSAKHAANNFSTFATEVLKPLGK